MFTYLGATAGNPFVIMAVKGGKEMYVSDSTTEFWRGTLRAFPEGLVDFTSALGSNDVQFVTFVICSSYTIQLLQLNQ